MVDNEDAGDRQVAKWIIGIAVASVFLIPIVLSPYVFWFSMGSARLSNDPAHWGAFGDYLGGVLGPALSSLAVLGLAVSIALQVRQIGLSKKQAALDEMQRLIATFSERIDAALRRDIGALPKAAGGYTDSVSLYAAFTEVGLAATDLKYFGVEIDPDWTKLVGGKWRASAVKRAIGNPLVDVLVNIANLAWLLMKYRDSGGSETVMLTYRRMYLGPCVWAYSLGMIGTEGSIHRFFKPEENLHRFVSEAARRIADPQRPGESE